MKARRPKRRSIQQRLLAAHRERLQKHGDVLGVGIGAAYSEAKNRITRTGRRGRPIHWTNLALKVLVREKRQDIDDSERIPRHVELRVGRRGGEKLYKFRVDVVTLGSARDAPGRVRLQSGVDATWPKTGTPRPGCRFLFGLPLPGSRPEDLPEAFEEFEWEIGTVGCVAERDGRAYVISAGHVVANIYQTDPHFPTEQGDGFKIAFDTAKPVLCSSDTHTRIVPDSPLTADGMTVDAVAILLPIQDFPLKGRLPDWVVPDSSDLQWFIGREGYVLVERDGEFHKVRGEVEAIWLPRDETFGQVTVTLPQTVTLRFYGSDTTEAGDSGAPVLALRGDKLNLLGFHFFEGDRRADVPDIRTFSTGTAAYVALRHVGAELISGAF